MTKPSVNEIARETNRLFSKKNKKSEHDSIDGHNSSFLQLGRRAYWTPDALEQMKDLYEKTSCPPKSEMQALSEKFNCDFNKVHTWFKNRRQQHRRKNNCPESKFQMDSAQSGGRVWFSKQIKDEMLEYFNEKPYLTKGEAEKLTEKWKIPEKKIENWFKNQRQRLRKEGTCLKSVIPKNIPNDSKLATKSECTQSKPGIHGPAPVDSKLITQNVKIKEMKQASTLDCQFPGGSIPGPIQTELNPPNLDYGHEESVDEEINVEDFEDKDADEDVPLDDLVIKHQKLKYLDQKISRVRSLEDSHHNVLIKSQPSPGVHPVNIAPYQTDKPMISQRFSNQFNHVMAPQQLLDTNFLQFCSMYQKYCHFLALQRASNHY